jgi:ABC-type Na+ efflux pump permease subunit
VRAALLLARKDLHTLVRSKRVMALLALYPIAIALLVLYLMQGSREQSIALVNEDRADSELRIGDETFSIDTYKEQAEKSGATIVELERDEAMRALDEGQVLGVLVIPRRTFAKLNTQLSPAKLQFYTGDNARGTEVTHVVRGLIYRINLRISDALVDTNAQYLKTLVEGGEVEVNGDEYELYGLDPIHDDLEEVREEVDDEELQDKVDRAIEFADDAGLALELAEGALNATASPIRLEHVREEGKSQLLTAQALSFVLAVAVMFICTIVVASSLATEREDRVLGRMMRSHLRSWQVIAGKLLFGATLGLLLVAGLFIVFAVLEHQAWARLPVLASIAASALGALLATLTRDARAATLVALLVILPLVPMALLPTNDVAESVSLAFPLEPARQLFNAVLFEQHPTDEILRGAGNLLLITAVAGALCLRLLRRLI